MGEEYPDSNNTRKSIRKPGHDYCTPGGYFVTICSYRKEMIFGEIINGEMVLNSLGRIAKREWFRTREVRENIELFDDEFVIMPNHIHGIIWIKEVGATGSVAQIPSRLISNSLGSIIGQYKSRTTREINKSRNITGTSIWQRNYYDRIIRNQKELHAIRRYIENNPLLWEDDHEM